MMELLAPVLLALLFVLFGLSHRGRSPGGCAACTHEAECEGRAVRGCAKSGAEPSG